MITAFDVPPESLNEYEKNLLAQISEFGWRSTHVFDRVPGEPSFTYTTGFWLTFNQPEIIVFDFPQSLAHDVLGQIAREMQRGRIFRTGEAVSGVLSGEDVYLFPVKPEAAAEHLISSNWFYQAETFPCLQLAWPDQAGHFPWAEGFDQSLIRLQPDLSERGWQHHLEG